MNCATVLGGRFLSAFFTRGHQERVDGFGRQQLSAVGLRDGWGELSSSHLIGHLRLGPLDNLDCHQCDPFAGKQLALVNTNSAVRTCGFDFSGNIIMFSTDKQMGYQCFLNFFDLRDPQQIGTVLRFDH